MTTCFSTASRPEQCPASSSRSQPTQHRPSPRQVSSAAALRQPSPLEWNAPTCPLEVFPVVARRRAQTGVSPAARTMPLCLWVLLLCEAAVNSEPHLIRHTPARSQRPAPKQKGGLLAAAGCSQPLSKASLSRGAGLAGSPYRSWS